MGALTGVARRRMNVLPEEERNTTAKIFNALDAVYQQRIQGPVARTQFYGCRQKPDEPVQAFILRLRELHYRLQQHHPDGAPTDQHLKEQFLLGLEEGPLTRALRGYARRHPDGTFEALQQEACLLEEEGHRSTWPENPRSQSAWRAAFATCRRVVVTAKNDLLCHVRLARRKVTIPARSEVIVWGRARMGPRGCEYRGLVEALEEPGALAVARTVVTGEEGFVEVGLVDACNPTEGDGVFEVVKLADRPDLTEAKLGAVEQRWVAQLASFDLEVKYRSGRENVNADALSRHPIQHHLQQPAAITQTGPVTSAIVTGEEEQFSHQPSEWVAAQEADEDIQTVKRYVEQGVCPSHQSGNPISKGTQRLLKQFEKLCIREGVLCRKFIIPTPMNNCTKLYVQLCSVKRYGRTTMKPQPTQGLEEHWPP
ncbi:hypothetical protein OJAV_G00036180 [Oryzias javanicus]|uniref:Retrotransposon gag domain-containing protein n=1 Tax=Oryzias javanicus TaxID=123683 RepID=A0A437DGC2_ORYJA|nr:hypothetical protein OJAV_G00036180 [Oryzias javanicus]